MNNKILSVVLVAGIAVTGFAGISAADEGLLGENIEQKVDMLEDTMQAKFGGNTFGKRKGKAHLSDEEKAALETMTDEEKQAFFEAKKAEMKAKKQAKSELIDALIAGNSLTQEQESLRQELITAFETKVSEGKTFRERKQIIFKLLSGETLSEQEQTTLTEMQQKRQQRHEQKQAIQAIRDKIDAGEEISEAEQTLLDEFRSQKKSKKRGGQR